MAVVVIPVVFCVGWTENIGEWSAGRKYCSRLAGGRREAQVQVLHRRMETGGAGVHWLHGVQGHECEPEAGKVSGHGLSR